jgi:hypothetical protein
MLPDNTGMDQRHTLPEWLEARLAAMTPWVDQDFTEWEAEMQDYLQRKEDEK